MLMLISKSVKKLLVVISVLAGLLAPTVALALVPQGDAQSGSSTTPTSTPSTSYQGDPSCNVPNPNDQTLQQCLKKNPIITDLNIIVDLLSGLVGVVVIGTIIVGGIQYTAAGNNPTLITAAKQRIMNGVVALLIFIFSFAFLQWLIPGGIFK